MPVMEDTIERPVLSEDIVSFTDCRGRLAEYFEKTRVTHRPVVVTQNGRATTVIVNLGDWEKAFAAWEESRQTREILADLQIGREQIAEGRTRAHKDVMRAMREKYCQ